MVDSWKVNQTSTNGAFRYWDLIETMIEAKWTQVEAGSNHADFDVKYPASIGGVPGMTTWEHLDVTDAWVRMQDPAGVREFIIHRRASATRWSLVYSKLAKFTGGSPSATVPPTATDELIVINNVNAIQPVTNSRHHCWASDVAPYSFYLVAYPVAGGNFNHLTMMDGVRHCPVSDTDPVIVIRGNDSYNSTVYILNVNDPVANTSPALSAWGWASTEGVAFNIMLPFGSGTANASAFANTAVPPNNLGQDVLCPGVVMRRPHLVDPMCKGVTTHFLNAGVLRASGDTFTVSTARDKIYAQCALGAFVLPFNGDIPLV